MSGNKVVACVNGRLDHFGKRVRVIQDTGDILKDCDSDLQKECQKYHEVAEVTILAVCPTLGSSATPVRTRESSNEYPRPVLEEVGPSVDIAYVKKPIGALEIGEENGLGGGGDVEGKKMLQAEFFHREAEAPYACKRLHVGPGRGARPLGTVNEDPFVEEVNHPMRRWG